MKNKIHYRLILLSLGALALLFGLTSSTTTAQTSAANVQRGGTLKVGIFGGLTNIGDPTARWTGADHFAMKAAIEGLVRLDPQGGIIPSLAISWQRTPDQKAVIFTLQKGVKFHDGTDFNSDAAKFNLDRLKSSGNKAMGSVSSIDVIDDYTIKINLSKYDSGLLYNLASIYGDMISPSAVKAHSADKDWLLFNPVGTGPFKLVNYTPDVSAKFTRWDGYWKKGKPYLDGVDIILVSDQISGLMLLKAQEIHACQIQSAKDALDLQATGAYTIASPATNVIAMAPDSANSGSIFSDIRIRRAISYAIDNQTIADNLGKGFYQPANQPASPQYWYYSTSVKGYPYNPQKAKELLAEVGYPKGFQTSIVLRPQDNVDVFTAVQGYLKAVGIDLKLEKSTSAKYNEIIRSGWRNSMVVMSVKLSGQDPTLQSAINFTADDKQFTSVLHSSDIDSLVNQLKTEASSEKSKELFDNLYTLVIDEYCLINPIYVNAGQYASSVKLHDAQIGVIAGYFIPENAWLSK